MQRGSVEGQLFHRGAVEALANGEPQTERLLTLVRKQLVRPDRAQLPREDAYRFRHLLIRDAAYDALPKSVRADLHRRFAAWLESHGRDLVELEEILGYHLEQAARCLADLGRPDAELAHAAAERLAAAGRRARWREDRRAAQSLLQRAIALSERPDVHLVVDLAQSLDDPRAAATLLDGAAERSDADGDSLGAALARALAAATRVVTLECSADEQEELALAALPLLEAADDHAGLAEVWASLASGVYNARGHLAQMEHASEEALRHATLAGQHQTSLWMLPLALVHGPRPAGEALAKLDALYPHPWTNLNRAALLAMSNRIEEARTVAGIAEDHLRELGDEGGHAHFLVATVERIAGNYEAAAERLRRAADYAAERGETAFLSTYALLRARTLCALGRYEEAEPLARQGGELAHEDDVGLWRQVAALLRAHHGDHAEAERLAREAVGLMQETDSPWWQGDALYDLGEVLAAAGHHEAAANAFQEALALYERKQIVPLARRTRERLAVLQPLQT